MNDQTTKLILGLVAVMATFGFVALIVLVEVPAVVHDIMLVAAGTMFSNYTTVYQYFFGSSAGSSAKDKVIAQQQTDRSNP